MKHQVKEPGHLPDVQLSHSLLAEVCKQGLLKMGVSEPAELPAGAQNATGKKMVPSAEQGSLSIRGNLESSYLPTRAQCLALQGHQITEI